MSASRIFLVMSVVVVACLVATPSLEAQCAMCRTALEGSEEGRAMAVQFNRGILFMLGAPFSVAAGIAFAMVRSRRRLQML